MTKILTEVPYQI